MYGESRIFVPPSSLFIGLLVWSNDVTTSSHVQCMRNDTPTSMCFGDDWHGLPRNTDSRHTGRGKASRISITKEVGYIGGGKVR